MVGVDDRALKESATWNHMTNVVNRAVTEQPANLVNTIENHSNHAVTGRMVSPAVTTVYQDTRPKAKQLIAANEDQDVDWAKKLANQVVPPKPAKKGDEEEAEEVAEEDKGELPDIVAEQGTFRTFGEGLSEIEAYRVTIALKRLLDVEPLAKVRFWGKILGTQRDYYICESKIDESRVPEKEEEAVEEAEQVGKPPETIYQGLNAHQARQAPRVAAEEGKGVNEFRYYVATSDDLTDWVALPDVLPAHVMAARQINKLFTGHLDAAVECHPTFPGAERLYLRAQIARISHATTVCPRDIFTTDAVEEEEEEEEENGPKKPKRFEVPAYEEIPASNPNDLTDPEPESIAPVKAWFYGFKEDELLEPKNWVHVVPQLLSEGRVTKFKSEEEVVPEEGEPEDEPPAPPIEYVNPFLSDLAHDAPLVYGSHSKSNVIPWSVRKAYSSESDSTRRFLIRSLAWPGAVCYAETEDDKPGAQFQNCYVGRGVKSHTAVYAPTLPPLPSVEFPTGGLRLMKDGTHDDELEFEPAPPPPKELAADEEENAEEDA